MLKTATTYPLKDPQRYDDEYGEGFAYAAVADETPPDGCWMADCWIVDKHGAVHPGYDQNPVPIRSEDLKTEEGFDSVMTGRKRQGWGWAR